MIVKEEVLVRSWSCVWVREVAGGCSGGGGGGGGGGGEGGSAMGV